MSVERLPRCSMDPSLISASAWSDSAPLATQSGAFYRSRFLSTIHIGCPKNCTHCHPRSGDNSKLKATPTLAKASMAYQSHLDDPEYWRDRANKCALSPMRSAIKALGTQSYGSWQTTNFLLLGCKNEPSDSFWVSNTQIRQGADRHSP